MASREIIILEIVCLSQSVALIKGGTVESFPKGNIRDAEIA